MRTIVCILLDYYVMLRRQTLFSPKKVRVILLLATLCNREMISFGYHFYPYTGLI